MTAEKPTVAIIVAAGKGERSGGGTPKQFVPVAGRPMLAHSYKALSEHPAIDGVLVVIGAGQEPLLRDALGDIPFVIGGASRRESVRNALEHLAATSPHRVLIHDAARPFLSAAVVDRLLASLDAYEGAIPTLPVADTLVRWAGVMGETVPRDGLYRVQTPQAFIYDAVLNAHRLWPEGRDATDDAQMVRDTGHAVTIVPGDEMLEKITYPNDFATADARRSGTMITRVGMGFDVHRLADGEELWLGGVLIPHSQGLAGHSDADVGLHALTDAILGAIAEGDIGTHFPPSDPQWRGASSDLFLQHAAGLVSARSGVIDHVDLTLICEAPKIGPHRPAMRERIAALLQLPLSRVSVKATTTERLGFAGRGEGIAAQAVATLRVPEDR